MCSLFISSNKFPEDIMSNGSANRRHCWIIFKIADMLMIVNYISGIFSKTFGIYHSLIFVSFSSNHEGHL